MPEDVAPYSLIDAVMRGGVDRTVLDRERGPVGVGVVNERMLGAAKHLAKREAELTNSGLVGEDRVPLLIEHVNPVIDGVEDYFAAFANETNPLFEDRVYLSRGNGIDSRVPLSSVRDHTVY
jgi:hypothetical protein